MILGAVRNPFSRPAAASGSFQPGLPNTGYYSHFQPFPMTMLPMQALPGAYRPPLNPGMGPTPLPDMPVVTPTPAPTAPQVPGPGGVSGFGGMGFGSTGGVRGGHAHVDPYRVMRQGMIPGVSPSGSNIRAGIRNASARVRRSMPFQNAPLPPLPPPAPVVMVAPAVAPGGTKGFFGALNDVFGFPPTWRKRTAWRGRARARTLPGPQPMTPLSPSAGGDGCETITDSWGLKKTICGGRVTRVEDQYGNVRIPGQLPPGF